MLKKASMFFLTLGVLLGAQTSFADQLVTNSGFETGDFSGWTITGTATNSAFASQFYGVDTQDAASGTYGAYLGSEFSSLTLSQTLTLQPSHYYNVSFSLAQLSAPSAGFTNFFQVSLAGDTVFSERNAPVSPYTNYAFTATSPAMGASGLLQVVSQNDLGYFSLDNVSVSTGAATPEPATLLLIAPVLGILAFRRRKSA